MAHVKDGLIPYLSPTAITTFSPKEVGGCNRRWWYRYVSGVPEDTSPNMILGTKIHKEIELYLLKGTPITSPLVLAGKHFLPEPKTVQIEVAIQGRLTAAGIPLKGFIDVFNLSGSYLDSMGRPQPMPPTQAEVIDWKSTADLRYAKVGRELLTTQMIGYAKFATVVNPELTSVRISHGYFQTRGAPKAIKNSVELSLDKINEHYQSVETVADQIKTVAKMATPEEVAPNRLACSAWKGCSYQNQCPKDKTEESDMTMIEQLRAEKAARDAATTAPTVEPQHISAIKQEIEAIKNDYSANPRLGTCQTCCNEMTANNTSRTPSGRLVHVNCQGVAILPPDAPEPAFKPQPAPVLAATTTAQESPVCNPPTTEAKTRKPRGPNKPKASPAIESPTVEPPALPTAAILEAQKYLHSAHLSGPRLEQLKKEVQLGGVAAIGSLDVIDLIDELLTTANNEDSLKEEIAELKAAEIDLKDDLAAAVKEADRLSEIKFELEGQIENLKVAYSEGLKTQPQEVESLRDKLKAEVEESARLLSIRVTLEEALDNTSQDLADLRKATPAPAKPAGLVIYANCRTNAPLEPLEPLIELLCKAIAEGSNVSDIRIAPKESPLAYGGWKGVLALHAKEAFTEGRYSLSDVNESEIKQVVLQALEARATVVRGY